ncbi:hypothetical protein KZ773_11720 [Escherichia coli]|nr:hypothetical protein [Escherichia coli]
MSDRLKELATAGFYSNADVYPCGEKMLMKLRAYAMSGGKRNYPSSPMA